MPAGSETAPRPSESFAGACSSIVPPEESTRMMGDPTSTVAPSTASSSVTTPAKGLGSSTSDLAVSISTSTWLTVTRSPGFTFQATISAAVRPPPTPGSGNSAWGTGPPQCWSVSMSVVEDAVDGLENTIHIRKVGAFELGGREGGVEPRHPQHGRLERIEGALGDRRGDLRADRDVARRLLRHDEPPRLLHRLDDGAVVDRAERAQVDDLDARALRGGDLGRLQQHRHHRPVPDEGHLGALAHDPALVQREGHAIVGHL